MHVHPSVVIVGHVDGHCRLAAVLALRPKRRLRRFLCPGGQTLLSLRKRPAKCILTHALR